MALIKQRALNVGDIEYVCIPVSRPENPLGLFPPDDFDNGELEIIRLCPKNVLQLNNPLFHYSTTKSLQNFSPQRFSVIYPDSVDWYIEHNPYKVSIKVFVLNSETEGITQIIDSLTKVFKVMFLIMAKNQPSIKGYESITAADPLDLIEKFKVRKYDIEKVLLTSFTKQQISFEVNLPGSELDPSINPSLSFKATHSNYWTTNQALGSSWTPAFKGITNESAIEDSKKAIRSDPNDTTRLKMIVDQIRKMDQIEISILNERRVKSPGHVNDTLSPLVLVVPFNFPTLSKVLDASFSKEETKKFNKILSFEQSLNYCVYTEREDVDHDDVTSQAYYLNKKISFLDSAAYLHASFTYSPILRLPLLGNSIKKELGFFKPETINDKKWNNSKGLINNFGKKLADLVLPEEFKNEVLELPRQIIAISDLPIEWMETQGENLCYSHDVTRIPEMPYGGILASFNINSNLQLTIGKNILERTLVLLGASDEDDKDEEFKSYFSAIEAYSKKLKYKTFRCHTKQDVIDQVRLHEPDLLIFDCHGGFDSDELSSYLMINNERLTGNDIVENKIVAPLVFLSACHTNPNYGYVNKLADAFFEAGCIAITATYFPISVSGGTSIYFRLLNNLSKAAQLSVHKNWLEFVSHVIRTSYYKDVINETIENIEKSNLPPIRKRVLAKELTQLNINIGLNMSRQGLRIQTKKEFGKKLEEICPKEMIDKTTIPEYCFYTNMGRGDLVRFSNWNKEFEKLNTPKK